MVRLLFEIVKAKKMDDVETKLTRFFAARGRLFSNPHDVPAWLREQLIKGYIVELEHGSKIDERLNVTQNKTDATIKIALAHLVEAPDYYTRLELMEKAGDEYWKEHQVEFASKRAEVRTIVDSV